MKKVFFQFGFNCAVFCFASGFFVAIGMHCVLFSILNINNLAGIVFICVVCGGMTIVIALKMIQVLWYRIVFFDEEILVSGDKCPKSSRVQYKDEILYSKIETIRIIYSSQSSKKKKIPMLSGAHSYPGTFFEFILNNRRKKWVHITYFSKKQRIKMIDIINEKTGLSLSYDQMLKESKYTRKSRE